VVLPAPLLEPVQLPCPVVAHPLIVRAVPAKRAAILSPARIFLNSFLFMIHLLSVLICEINTLFFVQYNLGIKKMVSAYVRFFCKTLTDTGIGIYPTKGFGPMNSKNSGMYSILLICIQSNLLLTLFPSFAKMAYYTKV
jgi:hypothetical protein